VVGIRFTAEQLSAIVDQADLAPLLESDLVNQVRFGPAPEYSFRHPLIRTVAYESQLKSVRAELHRGLAAAIERADPAVADEKAALIAEHYEAADDLFDVSNISITRETLRAGHIDEAVALARSITERLLAGGALMWAMPATAQLVESLLARHSQRDLLEAEAAIERLANALTHPGLVIGDIWLLRWRALLADANGDEVAYRDYRNRYREMADEFGFEGHMAWAAEMP